MTFKFCDRCACVTAYYLSNMPVSANLGLHALGEMDARVQTPNKAGDGIKICSNIRGWVSVKDLTTAPTVSHACIKLCYVLRPAAQPLAKCEPCENANLTDDSYMFVNEILETVYWSLTMRLCILEHKAAHILGAPPMVASHSLSLTYLAVNATQAAILKMVQRASTLMPRERDILLMLCLKYHRILNVGDKPLTATTLVTFQVEPPQVAKPICVRPRP